MTKRIEPRQAIAAVLVRLLESGEFRTSTANEVAQAIIVGLMAEKMKIVDMYPRGPRKFPPPEMPPRRKEYE